MFVDASAMVAIICGEPDAEMLSDRLGRADMRITSPMAVFETVAALSRKSRNDIGVFSDDVSEFLESAEIALVGIRPDDGLDAAEVHLRYGKRSGHPARLNMGDCFAYAMARRHGVPILYTGDDFSLTDLA